ncbi:MAG: DUF1697 domain-containing protein [Gemmatimonadetes bacterium]|nr:DUF1697 domain-containing protein [Gemmatimonadota bacterium]
MSMYANKYVAFLRAINVAGHVSLKMTNVRDAFAAAGCRSVSTYIQSGNVIFESSARDVATRMKKVRAKLRNLVGVEPDILIRTIPEIEELVRRRPFGGVEAGTTVKLYVAFLFQKPRATPRFPLISPKEGLEAVGMRNREVFIVSRRKKNGFFGFPNNFVEEAVGVSATTRNWSTVTKILDLVRREA